MRLEMMHPGLVVDAVRHLHEDHQVLRSEVQPARGPAEVEALVLAEFAFGVFARVALRLIRRWMRRDDLWRFAPGSAPDERPFLPELDRRNRRCLD